MSERLQITVNEGIAAAWREAADVMGVSLSSWVIQRVNRLDTNGILTQLNRRIDKLGRGPAFDEEERDMIAQLQKEHGKGQVLSVEQVIRLGVRTAHRQLQLNGDDVEQVRGE